MGRITNPYVLTALACTGGMLFGFDISSLSAIISSPNYLVYLGDDKNTIECADRPGALCNPGPSADVQGGITASMAGGSFLASLFSGIIADRFGRRYAIFVGCVLWVIGSILTCAVQNIAMLIVGRILNGACVGLCSAQVPVYLSELSPSRIRGRLVGCMNVMMYYLSYVFEMAGITGNIALVSNGIQYVINVVMTVPALLYVDRWDRRPTLLIGSTLMTIWLFAVAGLMATYGSYYPNSGNAVVRWKVEGPASKAVIACSYLFVASFAPTWGPWKSYIIFGCFTVAMTIHVFFAFPETAGKTLEEVDEIFQSGVPAWKTRKGSGALARDIEAVKNDGLVFRQASSPGSDSADEKELK
ncbi:hypothetical protein NDA16_003252 [Ustilago loliicola]|nr:hypothetical protein NDA16_003252 [Ustilago loliicola]